MKSYWHQILISSIFDEDAIYSMLIPSLIQICNIGLKFEILFFYVFFYDSIMSFIMYLCYIRLINNK